MNKSFIIKIIVFCLVTIKVSAIEKIVLFGDSLMVGYGLNNEHHLSVVLQEKLISEGYKIEVVNGSVSGSTSSGGVNRVEWTLSDSNIDLTTRKKDTISIVGESGSGKTSLIMLIGGLEKATSGKIYFQDQDLTPLSEDEVS